jgi:hypothetical protein
MLVPNTQVKFEVSTEPNGKLRAAQVRNLDDSPIVPPPRSSVPPSQDERRSGAPQQRRK